MAESVGSYIQSCQKRCQSTLDKFIIEMGELAPESLVEACGYSLSSGGKRIRPVLLYAAAKAVGNNCSGRALDYAAAAIEMIHTYSLVHDDLPAMDDDHMRRGKPSCHSVYGEAMAILVGDGLQAWAFKLLALAPDLSPGQQVALVKTLASTAGPQGMVGGQAVDILSIDSNLTLRELQLMHSLKTGALIRAALTMGGIIAGASDNQLAALKHYGNNIGLAFQIVDDVLDVEGDSATLGKTQGKDEEANKPTYVKLLGLGGAKKEARSVLASALGALSDFGESADQLRDLARYIVKRDH